MSSASTVRRVRINTWSHFKHEDSRLAAWQDAELRKAGINPATLPLQPQPPLPKWDGVKNSELRAARLSRAQTSSSSINP